MSAPAPSGARRARPIEPFTVAVVSAVLVACVMPVRGTIAEAFGTASKVAIALLFFSQGARLPREAIVSSVRDVRLHAMVLGTSFVVFPLLALLVAPLLARTTTPELAHGITFLSVLPGTIQSAVVLTSVARGNVAASVSSAALTSVLGAFVTPLWLTVFGLTAPSREATLGMALSIVLELVVPLTLGHLARPWLGGAADRHRGSLRLFDQGTLVALVYLAFSHAVVEGVWARASFFELGVIVVADVVLLAIVLAWTTWLSRAVGLTVEDEIAVVFSGSKKSLASGVPIANVVFSPSVAGVVLIPVLLFHQLQLFACTVLAERYARRPVSDEERDGSSPDG